MPELENHLGTIGISDEYLYSLVKYTVSTCYGVAGIGRINGKNFVSLIMEKAGFSKGKTINIDIHGGKLTIEIHISVIFGVNVSAVTDSLVHKLRYTIKDKTGMDVSRVTVYIDGMTG